MPCISAFVRRQGSSTVPMLMARSRAWMREEFPCHSAGRGRAQEMKGRCDRIQFGVVWKFGVCMSKSQRRRTL